MKRIYLIFTTLMITTLASLLLTGCSKDDEPAQDYYVRYTAIARPNTQVNMNFTKENGKNTLIQAAMPDGKFQYSVGPVKKGFEARLVVSYSEGGSVDYLSIEVAQGAEPFVLKKHTSNGFDLIYTIE